MIIKLISAKLDWAELCKNQDGDQPISFISRLRNRQNKATKTDTENLELMSEIELEHAKKKIHYDTKHEKFKYSMETHR